MLRRRLTGRSDMAEQIIPGLDVVREHQEMTNEEFVACLGKLCPVCRSSQLHHVHTSERELDDTTVWIDTICLTCEVQYAENYTLRGFVLQKDQ